MPGRPLLHRVMAEGRRLDPPEPLAAARERCRAGLASLPAPLRSLEAAPPPPVGISPAWTRLARGPRRRAGRGPRPARRANPTRFGLAAAPEEGAMEQ